MTNVTRRGFAAGAAGLAGAALPGIALASAARADVPFLVTRNRIWTGVMLDDQGPFAFLLDTGATWFMVDPEVAAKVHLPTSGELHKVHTLTGLTQQPVFHLRRIAIANKVSDNNVSIIGLREDRNDITVGVIPLTTNAATAFDFDANVMTVQHDRGDIPADYQRLDLLNMRGGSEDYTVTGQPGRTGDDQETGRLEPTKLRRTMLTRQPIVEGRLDGKAIRLMIDTGEPDGLTIFPSYVRTHGLWDRYAKFLPGTKAGLTGQTRTRIVRPERLEFGRFGFDRPIVSLADPSGQGDAYRLADGVIGVEMMRRLNFIIDPDRRVAALKPNKAFGDIWRYDRAGLSLDLVGKSIQVVDVAEDGPAWKAGMRKGAVVTGWAGGETPAKTSPYFGLLWSLQGKPGTEIGIQVDDGGKPFTFGVVLEDRI